jgi:diguanylate cyclase (GGDEF)-like protein
MQTINDFSFEQALDFYGSSVSALLIADENDDTYRALVRRGVFLEVLSESGTYTEMVHRLWFHRYEDGRKITDTYNVFIPNMGKFNGKYSKRIKLLVNDIPHLVQMSVVPIDDKGQYLFILDELDERLHEEEAETENKVSSIQNNIYVFTMAFDLNSDTTSSVALTEISNEPLNYQLKYSEWRNTIVNMIPEDEQKLFLKRSDPDYLRSHFKPGDVDSFDIQMVNLDGVYQWVKLIFSRMETTNENDFRFVYMVQNIHEATISMKETLKQYEELASTDALTKVFNHGRIETELRNAIEQYKKEELTASLMILDIDHFKSVNDSYGHAVGDTTLVNLAEVISKAFTEKKAAVGRWGGEEFAVVIYGESGESLRNTAESLRSSIEEAKFEVVGSITCSIGVTELRTDDTPELWFARADHALYTAKSTGRNRVCYE